MTHFPRKIGYELTAPDRWLAWIEGPGDGGAMRIEFRYARVDSAAR